MLRLCIPGFVVLFLCSCSSGQKGSLGLGESTPVKLIRKLKISIINNDANLFRSCFGDLTKEDAFLLDSMQEAYSRMYKFESFLVTQFGENALQLLNDTDESGIVIYPLKGIRDFVIMDDNTGPSFELPTALMNREIFYVAYNKKMSRYYVTWRSKFNTERYRHAMQSFGEESILYAYTLDLLAKKERITMEDVVMAMDESARRVFREKNQQRPEGRR